MIIKGAQGQRVCRHIRSQESFYSETPHVEDQFHSGIYWCNQTGDGLGMDGKSSCLEECTPNRACYED